MRASFKLILTVFTVATCSNVNNELYEINKAELDLLEILKELNRPNVINSYTDVKIFSDNDSKEDLVVKLVNKEIRAVYEYKNLEEIIHSFRYRTITNEINSTEIQLNKIMMILSK